MFEKASRLKLRFGTAKGSINVEDLWDLPLTSSQRNTSLDDVAIAISKQLGETSESFVVKKTNKTKAYKDNELRLDIVKHVIKTKLEEADQAEARVVAKQQKDQIGAIIAEKEKEGLMGLDVKELKKMHKAL